MQIHQIKLQVNNRFNNNLSNEIFVYFFNERTDLMINNNYK